MADARQAEFCRAVRGAAVTVGAPPPVEPLVLGLSSIARAAIRRVHRQSAASAVAYFDSRASGYLQSPGAVGAAAQSFRDSVQRYIQWDATAAPAQLDLSQQISFGAGNSVRALAHVVVDDGTSSTNEVRVVLWDDLPVTANQAELIALPVLECVEGHLGAGTVSRVEIWQLGTNQREAVTPASARACYAAVQHVLSQL